MLSTPITLCLDRWSWGPHQGTCLPQKDVQYRSRIKEIENNKKTTIGVIKKILATAGGGKGPKIIIKIGNDEAKWESIIEICNKFNTWGVPLPIVTQSWYIDKEFGMDAVSGFCPKLLTVVRNETDIPRCLTSQIVVDDYIGLVEDDSLFEMISNKRLYMIDLSFLSVIKSISSPVCLFYQTSDDQLLPIVLQLSPYGTVFTPNDNSYAWIMAKLLYKQAALYWKIFGLRRYSLHSVADVAAQCTTRNLSIKHPIRQLLEPYLKGADQIKIEYRKMLSPGGALYHLCGGHLSKRCDDITHLAKRRYHFINDSVKIDLERRGFDGENPQLSYPYAESAIPLWNCIEDYCSSIIGRYYMEPRDITSDPELNCWITELREEITTVPYLRDYSKDPLVFICSSLVWLCTGGASAWRGDHFDNNSFCLEGPFMLNCESYQLLPKSDVDLKFVLSALPSIGFCETQMNFIEASNAAYHSVPRLLSQESQRLKVFPDQQAQSCYLRFIDSLAHFDDQLSLRNQKNKQNTFTGQSYKALLPSQVAMSLTI